jgi:23S rRNA pseudouridine1911/1915/1917 synthase
MRSHQISVFGEEGEYGLLNRLDNVTSWLLYFARSYEAKAEYMHLQEQWLITKTYYAQVYGTPKSQFGRITTPIYHHRDDASRMTTDAEKRRGKAQEVTTYREIVKNWECRVASDSLLKITITSGCRHQIRCHLASIGHPIVGDGLYMTKWLKKQYTEYTENEIELISSGLKL